MSGTTKNALHSKIPTNDLEIESGSLIIESKKNSSLQLNRVSSRHLLFSILGVIVYTVLVVLITWAATKENNNNTNTNTNNNNNNDDDALLYPNTILRKIQHVAVMTPNLTEARAWYIKYFDVRRMDCPPTYTGCYYMLNDMGVRFGVIPVPETVTWVPPTLNGFHFAHFGLEVRSPEDYIFMRTRLMVI